MTAAIFFRRLDYVLLAAVAGVVAFGSVTILSVADAAIERRHLAYVAIGVVLAVIIATVDLRLYRKVLWPGYAALLLLLLVVLGLEAARGSSRWISLPGFNLQPSEIGKVIVIVVLAAVVAEHGREKQGTWRTFDYQQGLVHNNVRQMAFDSEGVMWLATEGGVSRYDGREFVNFTVEDGLPVSFVTSVCPDAHGAMWFGLWGGGVTRYDPAAERT